MVSTNLICCAIALTMQTEPATYLDRFEEGPRHNRFVFDIVHCSAGTRDTRVLAAKFHMRRTFRSSEVTSVERTLGQGIHARTLNTTCTLGVYSRRANLHRAAQDGSLQICRASLEYLCLFLSSLGINSHSHCSITHANRSLMFREFLC
jgi:hypothetical protein